MNDSVTLVSLEALILKATHESLSCPDHAAFEAFCTIMREAHEGPMLAAQTLAARLHSPNPREALLTLTMIDWCMRRTNAAFRAEAGKFRFLNEMIKHVSPKYLADRTAPEVKSRVLHLLYSWSIDYPKETKFKVAYDMLKHQGVVKETSPGLVPEDTPPESPPETPEAVYPRRTKNAIFEDEEKSTQLRKLLQSKKPEDILSANKLIKTMVREEERRNEATSRHALEVSSALDSVGLLRDMLDRSSEATADEIQIIHELKNRCDKMRPTLQRLAVSDAIEDRLGDILDVCDALEETFQKYDRFVADKQHHPDCPLAPSNNSLLDFAGAGDGTPKVSRNNVIDDLDVFSNDGPSIAEPLKPVSLVDSGNLDILEGNKAEKTEGWNELDSLGEQLLRQSLPENAKRVENFNSKQTKKIPMNALDKSAMTNAQTPDDSLLDLDYFNRKPDSKTVRSVERAVASKDNVMTDMIRDMTNISSIPNNVLPVPDSLLDNILDLSLSLGNENTETVENKEHNMTSNEKRDKKASDVKPLTDIDVSLESVTPSKAAPLIIFEEDEGLTVTLHFCADKPRPDVNVFVISTCSKSRSPIEDFRFQAVVPKGCKCRLLAASGASLPPFKPFLPPPALTQVLLIATPRPPPPVNLKFVITYTSDDDTCSEMGEKLLPLDAL